jgi:hypothetical protein
MVRPGPWGEGTRPGRWRRSVRGEGTEKPKPKHQSKKIDLPILLDCRDLALISVSPRIVYVR